MKNPDYGFICSNLAALSGFCVRHYVVGQLHSTHALAPFPVDPVSCCCRTLLESRSAVGYYITDHQTYYGVVHCKAHALIIGPVSYVKLSHSELLHHAQALNVPSSALPDFINAYFSQPVMNIQNFLHMLAMVNYYLSGQAVPYQEILFQGCLSEIPHQEAVEKYHRCQESLPQNLLNSMETVHNTLQFENAMLECISNGDIVSLNELLSSRSPGNIGRTSKNQLRQLQNTLVVTATLASRAAIMGGVSCEEAFSLSDSYIQQAESLQNANDVLYLHQKLVQELTCRVADTSLLKNSSRFVRDVTAYVQLHISESIRLDQMAEEFYMSRSRMAARFKEETGITLSAYITSEKIRLAKVMLSATKRSISEISGLLGFSSQSHFQTTFKAQTGLTPKQFREKT